jgi:glutathione S-transferase
MALEIKGIPYQMVEILPADVDPARPEEMLEVNPEGHIPSIRHGNWGVWESGVVLEYLEDLGMGHPLLPLGNPQLRAHCRLWTDHINRKILPAFYSLLLTPPPSSTSAYHPSTSLSGPEQILSAATSTTHSLLITTLQNHITSLVNASHASGPFFLGSEISFVDICFAPWIIRLSRVLSYYRNFPRPEVGTRWRSWVDAVENDERVRRTVSEENSYHGVYRGVGVDGMAYGSHSPSHSRGNGGASGDQGAGQAGSSKPMVEIAYARSVVNREGFGLGGDVWGRLPEEDRVHGAGGLQENTLGNGTVKAVGMGSGRSVDVGVA